MVALQGLLQRRACQSDVVTMTLSQERIHTAELLATIDI